MKHELEQIDNPLQYERRATLKDLEEAIGKFNASYSRKLKRDPITDSILNETPKLLCIPWSAGSGKTTTICEFIAKYWKDGIVYSTKTIDELREVRRKIEAINPSEFLNKKRIVEFHSEDENWEFHKNNPEELMNYRILLVTDATMTTMPYSILLNQLQQMSETRPGGGTRKWILTDEKPTLFNKIVINRHLVPAHCTAINRVDVFSDPNPVNSYFDLGPRGKELAVSTIGSILGTSSSNLLIDKSSSRALKTTTQETIISKLDPVTYKVVEVKAQRENIDPSHINTRRLRVFMEQAQPLAENYAKLEESAKLGDTIDCPDYIQIQDISTVIGPTHINFDGTGDILFSKSNSWEVAENKFPYQFKGQFLGLPNYETIRRNYRTRKTSESGQSRMKAEEEYIENLVEITLESIEKGETPLVITWKNLHSEYRTTDSQQLTATTNLQISDEIVSRLTKEGKVLNKDYSVTYWQSGKTRATNEFIHCDTLLALEPLYLPDSVILDINSSLKSDSITAKDVFKAEFVQAIYRTQIRCDKPVKVYVSEELLDDCIAVQEYLGCSLGDSEELLDPKFFYMYYKPFLRKNHFEDLAKLAELGFLKSMTKLEFSSLQELFNIGLRSNRKLQDYRKLFESLKEVGISVYISGELVN